MITILSEQTSVVNHYLRELRDIEVQQDQTRFERNLERLAMIAGYELSKQLTYQTVSTQTPLATTDSQIIKDDLVIATILRAGLPVQHGVHQVFDTAALAFIGAGRASESSDGVTIDLSYVASSDLTGKTLIIADTMLATGKSLVEAYQALIKDHGQPAKTYIVGIIASQSGIDYVQQNIPDVELLVCTVDAELNDKYYIVPGLGDAGDLLYGPKQ